MTTISEQSDLYSAEQVSEDACVVFPSEDATFPNLEQKIFEIESEIESTMDYYDHIAFIFLTCLNPLKGLQRMNSVNLNYRQGRSDWCKIAVSPVVRFLDTNNDKKNVAQMVVEVLYVLQQHKLLKLLQINSDPENVTQICPFRLKLFRIIDQLPTEKVEQLVQTVHSLTAARNLDEISYPFVEMYLLDWINRGIVTKEDHSLFDESLVAIGLGSLIGRPNPVQIRTLQPPSPGASINPPTSELITYKVSKGLCIIVNQMNFHKDPQLPAELYKVFINAPISRLSTFDMNINIYLHRKLRKSSTIDTDRKSIAIICRKHFECWAITWTFTKT